VSFDKFIQQMHFLAHYIVMQIHERAVNTKQLDDNIILSARADLCVRDKIAVIIRKHIIQHSFSFIFKYLGEYIDENVRRGE